MASQSVLELAVNTGKWDSGLKKAKSALDNFTTASGGLQQALGKDADKMQKFVQMMGSMDSKAKTAKGQMNDYKGTIEQLTMQYNRMTEAQQKTIGQDYLMAIDQLRQKYQAVNQEVQQMNRNLQQTPSTPKEGGFLSDMGGKMSGALAVFGGNMMTKAAGAIANLGSEMYGMVQQGIELAKQGEGIRNAFERLGRGDILDGLREATHGTVTDLELMKAAVMFNDFKLPLEELGTMLAFAQQKAKDTGQSVDYMVDSIVTGLGRKSLMILDNLGLSAAEIKDKMKDTGDMTKAVGAIIREQMAKAGDYVETAADRAAQANVSLQNKMEELGRKFAPVEEASNQLWTSMKIGILDVIGGPLATLLNQLTEAGRMRNALSNINNSTGTGQTHSQKTLGMLKHYRGDKQGLYNRQVARYNELENQEWRKYNQLRTRQSQLRQQYGPMAGGGLDREMENARNRALAWQQIRAEYQKGAASILNPGTTNTISINNPTVSKGGNGIKTTKQEIEAVAGSIDYQTKKVQELQKAWRAAADDDSRQKIKKQIEEAKFTLDILEGKTSGFLNIKYSTTDLVGRNGQDFRASQFANYAYDDSNEWSAAHGAAYARKNWKLSDDIIKYVNSLEKSKEKDPFKEFKNFNQDMSEVIGSVNTIASGIEQLGMDIPEDMKDMLSVLNSITVILASIEAVQKIGTVLGFFGAASGGVVKAAGGWVGGRTFSGDLVPARLNAGELVLNQAQAGVIANALQDRDFGGGVSLQPYVDGEKIFLGMNNTSKRMGRGEIVTTGTLRRLGLI